MCIPARYSILYLMCCDISLLLETEGHLPGDECDTLILVLFDETLPSGYEDLMGESKLFKLWKVSLLATLNAISRCFMPQYGLCFGSGKEGTVLGKKSF